MTDSKNLNTIVRAFWRAVKIESASPPYDTIHLKVFYPARMSASEVERDWGIVPADCQQAPFPIVIFFNGVNCSPEIYQWLAVQLAQQGIVTVTFAWVAENIPGLVALTPGAELNMWQPDKYGTGPTASALPTLLEELERINSEGILANLLDLQKVILGGHSAGGRLALENAEPRFFYQVKGAFGYGVHSAAPVQLGYAPNTILSLPDSLPLLIMGGTRDGVIANSSYRYGISPEEAMTLTERTFTEGISGERGDSYLIMLEGANHFSIAYPPDSTTGRPFLDFSATCSEEQIRSLLAEAINLFIKANVCHQQEASKALAQLLNSANPLIAFSGRK
jgi:hypothetical protein